ncbi:variant erythrocyte surface antigen-1 alpha subunit [Babesia bovis T2Bo]|uniref:Variant erythrocyte surface antigen-1, alpha subunit n=1 Tax=Babesia bovis TaxID=5865 RepID=A7AX27_BABBO|nr:variant erythrocyte surface antigen-1 alpha subunit [Babesia bovis T2Bo]EDO05100.1 variant erythrocyte surface antigen-1 alpha subunit [Babesia bovis T2Bo]|eukprot:XP_001608668.1 variant erythrocyte surface antigen-1, alpha subunit [Babesia bovis T2Bo]
MAPASTFTPKASLTEAPTNLKEAIDWVLRVTGRDGKALNKDTECICGLAAAVTDLLQSVELEYHGYQGEANGDDTKNGPPKKRVTMCLNELFSLVQGLGGTAVVRTYIDQLAQVLSALVGWSEIEKCWDGGCGGDSKPHGQESSCQYLGEVERNGSCDDCGCMKWEVPGPTDHSKGHHLGRGCTRCKGSSGQPPCECSGTCTAGKECQCALAGKCCKCCCTDCRGRCKNGWGGEKECICKNAEDSYRSAYPGETYYKRTSYVESIKIENTPSWNNLQHLPPGSTINSTTITQRRHQCARILLGSVCLIWSGITYMYWTGKYHSSSPRWNNHILDGTGLDDGTLSQWLQALGFPKAMLNNSGPQNRLDKVIWDGISDKLLLGFAVPSGLSSDAQDSYGNTARGPFAMNYPGFIHTAHRDSFNTDAAIVFPNGSSSSSNDIDQHKRGALFKLYILSCAYFTGLQKKTSESATLSTSTNNPKTIREILYWLSALPYSQAYPKILKHGKHRLEKVLEHAEEKQLKFIQTDRPKPITVHEFNLFAHFQAVTQYCPLVLIGIQGGIHSTDKTLGPAIHALYANTACRFTYPAVPIQAYNQVVHYIRALFYQLYFLRKQCEVKVTCGGKWRECRYGHGVVSKGVISWMCLGCNPMEHDRKCRVDKVKEDLVGLVNKVKVGLEGNKDEEADGEELFDVLKAIGSVVVQLGNAQEALEGKAESKVIEGVKQKLGEAKKELEKAKEAVESEVGMDGKELEEAKKAVEKAKTEGDNVRMAKLEKKMKALENAKDALNKLMTSGGSNGALNTLANGGGNGSLQQIGSANEKDRDYSSAKDQISDAINGINQTLEALQLLKRASTTLNGHRDDISDVFMIYEKTITDLKEIYNSPKCPSCESHSTKCGQQPQSKTCPTCHQQYMDGTPSPLQAFLEDRLPGFSCSAVVNQEKEQPDYPLAASHLWHSNGTGQCCPVPMGFRGHFHEGSISGMTGQRLYGILYFFSNENMMQSCVYTLVRVTAELSATTPQVLGDVFGFFRGGVGNKDKGKPPKGELETNCDHTGEPSKDDKKYFCGWCASGLRDVVKAIEWIPNGTEVGGKYRESVGEALIKIKGDKGSAQQPAPQSNNTSLSRLTKNCQYLSPLTGELYTAVSATFGGTYLSWVLYLSDALEGGLQSLSEAFRDIECRGCRECDPNKCKKGHHGDNGGGHYGNPFNLEGYRQGDGKDDGDYSIMDKTNDSTKKCHQFLDSLSAVIKKKEEATPKEHPLTKLLSEVGKLQYDIRLPWIFVLTVAWLVAVLYLAFGAIWPLDWTHMRSHWLRGGEHQWQCMWYKVMTGRKGVELVEYFGKT